ncbi:patatin-like phospholipase family protein, partial [Candidatus Pacearchaeota archaeon]|nr:patatin-like phospholipase family protein [Candidatus Pacearchaeota archaeon]
RLKDSDFTPNSGTDLQREPYTTNVILTDGGVYDNLGLETAWKRYDTILVSDAGGKMPPVPNPKRGLIRHALRITGIIDNQVRALRKRQLIESFKLREKMLKKGESTESDLFRLATRDGCYWGIRTDITHYKLPNALNCPLNKTTKLADIQTRLAKLCSQVQERLINWGYAVCDAAMRKHVDTNLPIPSGFPFEDGLG